MAGLTEEMLRIIRGESKPEEKEAHLDKGLQRCAQARVLCKHCASSRFPAVLMMKDPVWIVHPRRGASEVGPWGPARQASCMLFCNHVGGWRARLLVAEAMLVPVAL